MVDWLADHIYHTTLGVIYLLKSKDAQTHRHSRWFLVPRTTVLGTATKVDNTKRTAHLRRPYIILFHPVFCVTVAAAIDLLFLVYESELVNDLLLH